MADTGMEAPTQSVVLDPVESLAFQLQPQASPQAVLTIRNVSETRTVAFKVKTTRPLRYLVRPNQGMLAPNTSASIMVILQQKDCDELMRLDPSERQLSNDKFLVQSLFVDESFYEMVKTKSAKEMADELTAMWANTDKRCLANKKLRCRFTQAGDVESDATPPTPATPMGRSDSLDRFSSNPSLLAGRGPNAATNLDEITAPRQRVTDLDVSTPEQLTAALLEEPVHKPADSAAVNEAPSVISPPSSGNGKDAALQEVAALRKKYDELVAFTVQLTAQRDALMGDLEKTYPLERLLRQLSSY
ncbi:hypothetical protein P43SY_007396 [Pythium insidiosum]|uniref:MSP domain-containing protein n=1 Tax=Pythium insidiosum TaxID=114742 RepID=A0AAD5LAJ8_PYTIN|nr:hypothetical protein P43SY_007396 [Pythium insidiosum]